MYPTADERFTRLYQTHYRAVVAYCARRVNRSDAEDLANEVFVVLWRRLDELDGDDPLPWLYRVAWGAVRNRRRSMRRLGALRMKIGGIAESSDPVDVVVVQNESDRQVLEALARLSASDQEVLRLSIWEELSAPQIAVVIGCSASAAGQRLHRARKRLARHLSAVHPNASEPSRPSLEGGGHA